jgi:hypothetical protein
LLKAARDLGSLGLGALLVVGAERVEAQGLLLVAVEVVEDRPLPRL